MHKKRGVLGGLRLESGLLLIGICFLSSCVYLLSTVDQRARASERIKDKEYAEEYMRFADVMAEVFLQIQNKYLEEVDPQKVFEGALMGMFASLDPHSAYLGPDNFKELEKNTEGEFSGIGIHIDLRDGVLTVISPIPGTPAARAGLMSWDRIIRIEGESTEGMTTMDAIKLLTGPQGTKVTFTVYRESERREISFTIIRDRIEIESVYTNVDEADYVTPYFRRLLELGIGYARITRFSENTTTHLAKALEKMDAEGVRGLILDMRWNPGGLLEEAISTADLFLSEGQVVVGTKGRDPEQSDVRRAENDAKVDWPVIVLVNKGSASAVEILSGALQDHGIAVLLGPEGENTYGKAKVQTIMPLSASLYVDDEGNPLPNALRLSTAKYYTPNNIGPEGKSIDGVGLTPDLSVPVSLENRRDIINQGLLLGDPAMEQPGEETPAEGAEGAPDSTEEVVPTETSPEDTESGETEESPDAEGDIPFYLQPQEGGSTPTTIDVQLKYGVDVLKALLIVKDE